jgi:aspartyl-tRNA(Asn)/glutamyl-tRNA(Gln) amidotransferase subunit A
MELYQHTAHQLQELYKKNTTSADKVYASVLKRIDTVDKKVKACVMVNRDGQRAAEVKGGALEGLPVLIKDNICVKGEQTTCSSKILKDFKPPYDATVVERLKQAGARLLGKANMDEFAFGSSCETSCYGPTHNPWDLTRIPGGSSGGAAAAVAADEAILALGSDTGGSIRQPAALCGVVGMKPTYGRVSRYGLIAFASSLDQIGPITKDVRDAALLMNVIAGHDPMDSTSADLPVPDYTASLATGVKGLKIGIPKECFIEGVDPQVEQCVGDAVALLKRLGAESKEISLPNTAYAVSCYYIVAPSEASSNLARFDGVQYGLRSKGSGSIVDMYVNSRSEGFGDEAKRRIILGTYSLSSGYYDAYYLRAMKVRTKIREDFEKAFQDVDCIVTPTSPTPAFKIGERMDSPLSMYLSDIFTIPANLAGIPGISVPCGFTKNNLPIGLQILGKPFDEELLFRVAYTYEQNTDWHKRKPKL